MPGWREMLSKQDPVVWWGAVSCLGLCFLGLSIYILVAAGYETADALNGGRRLVIAMETGEVTGTRLKLDGTVIAPPKPESPPPATPDNPEADSKPVTGETPAADHAEEELGSRTPTAEKNMDLVERTPFGDVPLIGRDGTKPWRYYAKTFERDRNVPMVAVIVTGLGIGRQITKDALDLPENVTLSFSPYTRDAESWASAIRATGHELLLDMPLQPTDYPATDPGPQGILLSSGEEQMKKNLQTVMARFPAYIGMLTPQNEAFTSNDEGIKALLQSFANRGLLFIMGREPHKSETRALIDNSYAASLTADLLIDEEFSTAAIQTRFSQLEDQARKNGFAVGIIQAYPLSVGQLSAWIRTLEEKGLILVPLSAVAKLRFS